MKTVGYLVNLMVLMALPICAVGALEQSGGDQMGWQPVPLRTAEAAAAGIAGGEGCQWVRALVISGDASLAIWGTDVGGLFRSKDGGRHWEPCNVAYAPRGTAGLAIDPGNAQRVLSVGANSSPSDFHGLWLSTDGASSWRQVLPAKISGSHDTRDQLAFDPSSWDADGQFTRTVYWSRIAHDKPMWGSVDSHPALYRSNDGGETWHELANTTAQGGGHVAVHPTNGAVYVGTPEALYRSDDHGATFAKLRDAECTGLDVHAAMPDALWLTTPAGVWRSDDQGASFQPLALDGLAGDGPVQRAKVSPADPQRLHVWRQGDHWQWRRWTSHDGGATVQECSFDNTYAFMPCNARQSAVAWHPSDPEVALSTGGDWPTRSDDGGRTWAWSANGVNVILVGGSFHFSSTNPDVLFVGSQDYNGALTVDGGSTWRYSNPAQTSWGGFTYGGYAASESLAVVGKADSWGGTRHLLVSDDGGTSWRDSGHTYAGLDTAISDPAAPEVLFASQLRSGDAGATWQPMDGCEGVLLATKDALWGGRWDDENKRGAVVRSLDHGVTWTAVAELDCRVADVAAVSGGDEIWVAGGDQLHHFKGGERLAVEGLPRDQWGGMRITSVAIDPHNEQVIYVVSHRDLFATDTAVICSTDGGRSWTNLTVNVPLEPGVLDGGREAFWVRVHPVTGWAWVATSCYGIWRHAPPQE
ncbi:MAG: hypothetical protein PF961_23355 [Planctomycetota bacterium]|nr:hypothetical protein [Planctomycetota bacterium]